MPAGYSGTPLAKKLGIKPEFDVIALDAPGHYQELLAPLPEGVTFSDSLGKGEHAFIHFFTTERGALEQRFAELKSSLRKNGILWISWPKKSSDLPSDLTRDIVREIGLSRGLVDTKICAVDETWSGLKFLYRLTDR